MLTIKQARVGVNKTQQEMVDLLGCHVMTYRSMEQHPERMSIEDAFKISRITGVSISDLIFLPDNSNFIRIMETEKEAK